MACQNDCTLRCYIEVKLERYQFSAEDPARLHGAHRVAVGQPQELGAELGGDGDLPQSVYRRTCSRMQRTHTLI